MAYEKEKKTAVALEYTRVSRRQRSLPVDAVIWRIKL